jgi:hypothetical protein
MMDALRVIVSGMVAGDPHQGGATWSILQYVLGLRRLGHDSWLVEPVDELRPESVAYFEAMVADLGLEGRAALVERGSNRTAGTSYDELLRAARGADLLLNVSGMLDDDALTGAVALRAYLDLDPAFNQLWHVVEGIDMGFDRHERFVTVGLELGEPGYPVPTGGRDWVKTLPPVVLEHWPATETPADAPVTTVGNWRGYGSVEWNGELYGQKAHSMRGLLPIARRSGDSFLLAFAIHPGEKQDLEALAAHGWPLADPREVAGTPAAYADFIRSSRAELAVAKSGYVRSRCGWFSDRSACYLASGRPVVAQDTGFPRHLPTGEGLLAFEDADGAVAALEAVRRDYARHAHAARSLAEELLDSDRVITRLLEAVA